MNGFRARTPIGLTPPLSSATSGEPGQSPTQSSTGGLDLHSDDQSGDSDYDAKLATDKPDSDSAADGANYRMRSAKRLRRTQSVSRRRQLSENMAAGVGRVRRPDTLPNRMAAG